MTREIQVRDLLLQLGTLGALTGFLASSLVNYNYGDAEVAMLFWFLMGMALTTDYADFFCVICGWIVLAYITG